jgi:hypothetical protein
MDCVNFVLQYVDSDALASLASQLIDLIKQPGIALGTKGAAVHVITALTHQCPLDLQQVIISRITSDGLFFVKSLQL